MTRHPPEHDAADEAGAIARLQASLDRNPEMAASLPGRDLAHVIARLTAAEAEIARLREAGQAVVTQWDTPNWKLREHTADIINRLRAALLNPEGADHG